jgi:hypothetical protein
LASAAHGAPPPTAHQQSRRLGRSVETPHLAPHDTIFATALGVPQVEALDVHLERRGATDRNAFHDKRGLLDDFLTGPASLAIARTAIGRGMLLWGSRPSASFGRMRTWRTCVSMRGLSVDGPARNARFTGVSALTERQPERPRCRQMQGYHLRSPQIPPPSSYP